MTFKAERLTRRSIHRLGAVTLVAGAPKWAADVEQFLVVGAPKQVLNKTGSALLVTDEDTVVAAAAHQPHAKFRAELLQAFLVLPERRGKGLAVSALECVLASIRADGSEYLMWLVHEENAPMRKVSLHVGATQIGGVDEQGFVVYAHP